MYTYKAWSKTLLSICLSLSFVLSFFLSFSSLHFLLLRRLRLLLLQEGKCSKTREANQTLPRNLFDLAVLAATDENIETVTLDWNCGSFVNAVHVKLISIGSQSIINKVEPRSLNLPHIEYDVVDFTLLN